MLGRPWPVAGQPLFTRDDTAWALAMAEYRAELCPGCGIPLAESTDPAAEFDWVAEHQKCHACNAREMAVDKKAEGGERRLNTLLWTVKKRPRKRRH